MRKFHLILLIVGFTSLSILQGCYSNRTVRAKHYYNEETTIIITDPAPAPSPPIIVIVEPEKPEPVDVKPAKKYRKDRTTGTGKTERPRNNERRTRKSSGERTSKTGRTR